MDEREPAADLNLVASWIAVLVSILKCGWVPLCLFLNQAALQLVPLREKLQTQKLSIDDCRSWMCVYSNRVILHCVLFYVTVVGFIFLCVLVAQAACGPVRNETKSGALNATFQLMREEIRTALSRLVSFSVLYQINLLIKQLICIFTYTWLTIVVTELFQALVTSFPTLVEVLH